MLAHAFLLVAASLILQQAHAIDDGFDTDPIRKLFQEINERQRERDVRSILGQDFSSQSLNQGERLDEESPKSLYKPYQPPNGRLVKIRINFKRNNPETMEPAEHRDHKTGIVGEQRGRALDSEEVIGGNLGEREKEFGRKSFVEGDYFGGGLGEAERLGEFGGILKNLMIGKRMPGLGGILIQRRRINNKNSTKISHGFEEERDGSSLESLGKLGEVLKQKENLEVSESVNPAQPLVNQQSFQPSENFRKNLHSKPTNRKVVILRKPLRRNKPGPNSISPNSSSNETNSGDIMEDGAADLVKKRPHRVKLVAHRGRERVSSRIVKVKTLGEIQEKKIGQKFRDDEDQMIQEQNYSEIQNSKLTNGQGQGNDRVSGQSDEVLVGEKTEFTKNSSQDKLANQDGNLDNQSEEFSTTSPNSEEFSGDFGAPNIRQPSQSDLTELRLSLNENRHSNYRRRLKGNVD